MTSIFIPCDVSDTLRSTTTSQTQSWDPKAIISASADWFVQYLMKLFKERVYCHVERVGYYVH